MKIVGKSCDDQAGLMKLKYANFNNGNVIYHYKPPTNTSFGDQPHVPDELALEYVECKKSKIHMEGIFAKKNIPQVTT